MTELYLLGLIAVVQVVFIVLLTAFVIARRERLTRRATRVEAHRARLSAPLAKYLSGGASARSFVDGLRGLPNDAALSYASMIVDTRIPVGQRPEIGAAMRGEKWVRWAIDGGTSWRWWRRLDAARALSVAGSLSDAGFLAPLLEDEHPAVRLAAMQALAAVDDPGLVSVAVQRYPTEALAVRLFITSTLRTVWRYAEPTLRYVLSNPDSTPHDLAAWLGLAESLRMPTLRPAITALATHENPEVRAAAVRALRRFPHEESVKVARELMNDPLPFVRSNAAQALGALQLGDSIDVLVRGLSDSAWWVRFRCALALALGGEVGREALRDARNSPDRFAREMAEMTSGLSEGALLELADA